MNRWVNEHRGLFGAFLLIGLVLLAVGVMFVSSLINLNQNKTDHLEKDNEVVEKETEVKDLELSTNSYSIELGSELPDLLSFVVVDLDRQAVEITYNNINMNEVGTYHVTYLVTRGDIKYEGHLEFNVVDTTAPTLVLKDVEVQQGEAVSIKDFVFEVKDEHDITLSMNVELDDLKETIGSHLVQIQAEDVYGNKTKENVFLTVTEKPQVANNDENEEEPVSSKDGQNTPINEPPASNYNPPVASVNPTPAPPSNPAPSQPVTPAPPSQPSQPVSPPASVVGVNKDFLVSQSVSYMQASSDCQNYIMSVVNQGYIGLAQCLIIDGVDGGDPLGVRAVFTP